MQEPTIAQHLFEIINDRNLDSLNELMTDQTVFHFPGTAPLEGVDRIRRFFRILFRQYPKLEFIIKEIIAAPDRVVVVWTNQGYHKSGKSYENAGVTIMHIRDGAIQYMSDYFKDTGKFLSN